MDQYFCTVEPRMANGEASRLATIAVLFQGKKRSLFPDSERVLLLLQ